ncbi:Hypp5322 [Branchiostoma lanceolatum]|uniref:Hypp5322 protein n=1 Tax=Branchiostoma lanceolatum TaxID=7740 RepID=A0A8K0AEJ5_BRALA|nr:Hypp5322 [Branchiostoma lanceolatum]
MVATTADIASKDVATEATRIYSARIRKPREQVLNCAMVDKPMSDTFHRKTAWGLATAIRGSSTTVQGSTHRRSRVYGPNVNRRAIRGSSTTVQGSTHLRSRVYGPNVNRRAIRVSSTTVQGSTHLRSRVYGPNVNRRAIKVSSTTVQGSTHLRSRVYGPNVNRRAIRVSSTPAPEPPHIRSRVSYQELSTHIRVNTETHVGGIAETPAGGIAQLIPEDADNPRPSPKATHTRKKIIIVRQLGPSHNKYNTSPCCEENVYQIIKVQEGTEEKSCTENLLPKLEGQMTADVYGRLCGLTLQLTKEGFECNPEQFYAEYENVLDITNCIRRRVCDELRSIWDRAGREITQTTKSRLPTRAEMVECVVDFEGGMWRALPLAFLDVPIKGSAFHWTQTVWEKA